MSKFHFYNYNYGLFEPHWLLLINDLAGLFLNWPVKFYLLILIRGNKYKTSGLSYTRYYVLCILYIYKLNFDTSAL